MPQNSLLKLAEQQTIFKKSPAVTSPVAINVTNNYYNLRSGSAPRLSHSYIGMNKNNVFSSRGSKDEIDPYHFAKINLNST